MRSRSERLATFGTGILTLFIFIVLYAPVFISILFSVVEIKKGQILWETFSLTPYASLWSNPSVISALSNTAVVAVISVAISSVCAVILALYTNWEEAIGGRALEVIIYLPFLLPPIVTGLSLLVVSSQLGISRGLATIVLGHSLFVLAVSYRLALTRLQALPKSLVEASFDLGASRLQTLRYVLLPHLASAVMTGAVLALTLSFDETLITTFVAGDQMTLPLRLWAMMRVGFTPEINALVTLVLLISIGLSVIVAWRMRPQGEVEEE
ncbi:ABC transporter permease [Aestuariivirga sp.]|jgi:ABC-type spermidine/putrescine transport system permease subunit II|uniref:ABC transporter permease n=1 Tax=Aestuariivirga sp. TaxID=2650926 RepID=UPI0037833E07